MKDVIKVSHWFLRIIVILSVAMLFVLPGQSVPSAFAATTWTVQTATDTGGSGNASNCPGASCSMRDALAAAASGDMISFGSDMTITLASSLEIAQNLTIDGIGHSITLSGNNAVRVITINPGVTLNLYNLMVAKGWSKTLTYNSGGGIYNNEGTLNATNCSFSGNRVSTTTGFGGAIASYKGTLNLTNCSFSGNLSSGNTTASIGGGIYTDQGTLNVTNCTFAGNSAYFGGGIYALNTVATLTNSTFHGNSTSPANNLKRGAGVFQSNGTMTVTNCTISGNNGSGIICSDPQPLGVTSSINNTIVADNAVENCSLSFVISGANNLSSDASCGGTFTQSSSILLGEIGSYGGSTQSVPLLPGSSAIDAGNDTLCATIVNNLDQRGVARAHGTHCDIGAFESRGFTLGSATGSTQRTEISTPFPLPLGLTVASTTGEPVSGGQVMFTAPATGGSLATTPIFAPISGDAVSATVAANSTPGGPYTVIASASGAPSTLSFSNLINSAVVTNTTTALVSDANPALPGQTILFTATVTVGAGTPTGTVAFKDNGVVISGCSAQTLSLGNAACSISSLSNGNHTNITAVYSGDATFNPSTSPPYSQTVKYNSTATVLSSPNPSNGQETVVFTATIAATTGTPTGTVTFYDNGSAIGSGTLNGAGQATMSSTSLPGGARSITATYGGDGNYNGSTSPTYSHTVNQVSSTITLASAPNPLYLQQTTVLFTATVASGSGTPTGGTVAFKNSGTDITGCSAQSLNSNGLAICSTNMFSVVGTYSNITAVYSGSPNYLGSSSSAYSQTVSNCNNALTVTNNNDSGSGSLRETLKGVCSGGTVTFAADFNIILASMLTINSSVTIDGIGKAVTISGDNKVRVFYVNSGITLNVHNLTVVNGNGDFTEGWHGGGGLYNNGGTVGVVNCTFSGNMAIGGGGNGGGIYNLGTLSVTNSTFTSNTAEYGGGISNGGPLTVINSTFSGNGATDYSGGIYDEGALTVINSTFFRNSGGRYGSGAIDHSGGTLTVNNSTFSGNTSGDFNSITDLPGTGLVGAIGIGTVPATFNNTIIANSSSGGNCYDFGNAISIDGANNKSDDASCGAGFTTSSTIRLGILGSHGGATQTIPLLPGSSALDAGNTATCITTDQRGKSRSGTCDIGAFESQGFTLTATGGNNQSALTYGSSFANPLQVTLTESGGTPLPDRVSISFSAPGSGPSASIVGSPATTDATGIATVSATANDSAGSYTVTASATNDASINASFSLTNIQGYTVTYNGNGGTGGTTPVDAGSYLTGATVTVLSNTFTKTGYTFAGWYPAADGSGTVYGASFTMGSANTVLYAKWTALPTYTVTYNGNGSTGGTTPTDAGSYLTGATVTVLSNTFTKTGYTFAGWYPAADGSGTVYGASFTMGSANTVLYAKWTALPTYTVTYNGNTSTGGTTPTDAGSYLTGATVTVLSNTYTKTGYSFAGWYPAADGSGTMYGASFTMGSANTVLYAKWAQNGSCGTSHVAILTTVPTDNLCTTGTPSAVSGTGPWTWTCTVDTAANCSAYLQGTVVLPKTGQTKCYQSVTPYAEIACAGTGQDGEKLMGAAQTDSVFTHNADTPATITDKVYGMTWYEDAATNGATIKQGISGPTTRFTNNNDGTQTDNLTGLIWLKDVSCIPAQTWGSALNSANTLKGDGSQCSLTEGSVAGDWRLPNIDELASLITNHSNAANPAVWLISQGFPDAQESSYWSSTTYANDPGYTWIVDFTFAYIDYSGWKSPSAFFSRSVWPVRGGQSGSLGNLAISKSGTGSGIVSSSPTRIECGTTCTANFAAGQSVVLTATPTGGSSFAEWTGCINTNGNECTVTATGTKSVTATFNTTALPAYTVTYNGNGSTGGTTPTDAGSYLTGATVTVLSNTFTKTGYTFAGWYPAADGSGTVYGASFTMGSANTVLYAKWTALPTYTVTYNGNTSTGGTTPTDAGSYLTGATVTVLSNTFTKTGYTFAGWYPAADGSGTVHGASFTMGSANTVIYAKWTALPTYTVTYNGNTSTGGTTPTDAGSYLTGATVTVKANTFTKTGYTFAGWYPAADGSGTVHGASFTMGSANTVLYAKWTALPTYTVSYNGNTSTGGAVPTDGNTYLNGATVTVLGNTGTLVKTGYTFVGWNTAANGTGTSYSASGSITFVMASANVTLYAQWTLSPTYTVTYDGNSSNNGTVPTDGSNYLQGAAVTVAANTGSLVNTGYTFTGWNTLANGTGTSYAASGSITFAMGSSNVTLFAQWTLSPTYTVTYNGNTSTSGTVPVDGSNYLTGATVTVLANSGTLVKTGYSFTGWNSSADGSGTIQTAASIFNMGSANVTLYAQWTALPTYTVTYNGNTSTSGTVPTDGNNYLNGATVTVLGNSGTLIKTGYTFNGWNTAANGTGTSQTAASTFAMGSANVTLYAQWTALPTYAVTYNGNSSTSGTVPVDGNSPYVSGTTVTVLGNSGTLAKTGFVFNGWNTAANGSGTSYATSATFNIAANTTLYAQWTALPTYTVTYTGNSSTGGAVPTDSNNYLNGATVTVLGNSGNLIKTGFTFNGWNTASNGTGTSRTAASIFIMGSANVTLYAQWLADLTGPTLTVSTLANGSVTNNATLNVTGTVSDNESGVKSVTVNGNPATITSGSYTIAITLVDGANTVTVIATDNANNTTTDSRTINLDRTAPGLTITLPTDNSTTGNTYTTVTGSVDDATATVTAKVNGGTSTSATMSGTNFTITLNLVSGLNTIDITATDVVGNSSSVKRTVTSDSSAPGLSVSSPAQDISTTETSITISGAVTESVTTATISIAVDGQTFNPTVATDGSFNQSITLATDKTYTVVVTATDLAGNRSTVQRNIIKTSLASGDISGDGVVDIADALRVLQIAVGLVNATPADYAKADVAPLVNGKSAPDGVIDIADATVILMKVVGLRSW